MQTEEAVMSAIKKMHIICDINGHNNPAVNDA